MIINNGEYTVGVDIGGTNIKLGILDYKRNLVDSDSIYTNKNIGCNGIVKEIIDKTNSMFLKNNISQKSCVFFGLGIPGLVNKENGKVLYAPNLNWREVSIVKEIKKYFDFPVFIDNDANCAVLGEYLNGAAIGKRNVVLITLGTGVGSGILIDGRIFDGGGPGGGELGHTTLIYNGIRCSCGRRGCAERYVSANALVDQCIQAINENKNQNNEVTIMNELMENAGEMNAKIPFEACMKGDSLATKLVEQYIDYLGAFIVNIINSFRPDIILLSGGICNEGQKLTVPLNKYVKTYSYGNNIAKVPEIKRAFLGNNAGIIGAANLHAD